MPPRRNCAWCYQEATDSGIGRSVEIVRRCVAVFEHVWAPGAISDWLVFPKVTPGVKQRYHLVQLPRGPPVGWPTPALILCCLWPLTMTSKNFFCKLSYFASFKGYFTGHNMKLEQNAQVCTCCSPYQQTFAAHTCKFDKPNVNFGVFLTMALSCPFDPHLLLHFL